MSLEQILKAVDELTEQDLITLATFLTTQLKVKFKNEVPQIKKANKMESKPQTRFNSKKFTIEYPGEELSVNEFNEIQTKLKQELETNDIYYTGNNTFNAICEKKKNITSLKKYHHKEREAVIRKFVDKTIETQNIRDYTNIEKHLTEFLIAPKTESANLIAAELAILIKQLKIQIHSEYVLSALFLHPLFTIGNRMKWKDLVIYSIDSKMELKTPVLVGKKKIKNIRCDLIAIYKDKLFIFEHKYRYERKNTQAEYAMKCIKKREYNYHVTEYINNHYSQLFKGVNTVINVGIGYSTFNESINCSIMLEELNIDTLILRADKKQRVK